MDTKFQVLGELFVELLVVFSILRDFLNLFNNLLDNVFLDDLQNLVVLKMFSGDVQW